MLTTSTLQGEVPRELARWGLPFVFLTREVDGALGDSAVVDNTLGASLMAAEVARHGHRRIGAIFGPPDTSTGRDRERGFRAGLGAAGLELTDGAVRHGGFVVSTGYDAMLGLMRDRVRPTVVVCFNDLVAIGALNAARALGLRVPEEVSVTGWDDLPMAAWDICQLTTVHQPMNEMARTAARLLVERIEGRAGPAPPARPVRAPARPARDARTAVHPGPVALRPRRLRRAPARPPRQSDWPGP